MKKKAVFLLLAISHIAVAICAHNFAYKTYVLHQVKDKIQLHMKQAIRTRQTVHTPEYKALIDEGLAVAPDDVDLLVARSYYYCEIKDFDSSIHDLQTIVALGDKADPEGGRHLLQCMIMEVASYPANEVKNCYVQSVKAMSRLRAQKGKIGITRLEYKDMLDVNFVTALFYIGAPTAHAARIKLLTCPETTGMTENEKLLLELIRDELLGLPFDRNRLLDSLRLTYGLPLKNQSNEPLAMPEESSQ